jgi:hypothetical protein
MSDVFKRLLSAAAVRARAQAMLDQARAGRLAHFTLDEAKLDFVADTVIAITREHYPDLRVPYHSRWRHFEVAEHDRFEERYDEFALTGVERARARVELAIVSVLLDAGAGDAWRFRAHDGYTAGRSEGLALASLEWAASGALSADPDQPWRVDAGALGAVDAAALGAAFQASAENPLTGLDGRAQLLQSLGRRLAERTDIFGAPARLGRFFDHLVRGASDGAITAPAILAAILDAFNPIWPGRIARDGVALGDVWEHPAIHADDGTAGLMPFHKLSQWLAYSLVEPLAESGLRVRDLDGLTGLAEYRNGGLFVDGGVLTPRDPRAAFETVHAVGSPLVVEWRALTVALLDLTAASVRGKLGLDAAALPLASVLQGGTWAAGRRLARTRRPGGGPPIRVASDGTVF